MIEVEHRVMLTAQAMRTHEAHAIDTGQASAALLMERAGQG
ncbi:hypothetical protein LCGC14_2583000, partial [marine sediment metagenome]